MDRWGNFASVILPNKKMGDNKSNKPKVGVVYNANSNSRINNTPISVVLPKKVSNNRNVKLVIKASSLNIGSDGKSNNLNNVKVEKANNKNNNKNKDKKVTNNKHLKANTKTKVEVDKSNTKSKVEVDKKQTSNKNAKPNKNTNLNENLNVKKNKANKNFNKKQGNKKFKNKTTDNFVDKNLENKEDSGLLLKKEIAKKYNINGMVVDLLFARGYDTEDKIEEFLNPTEELFHDPFKLKGMHSLVKRINRAVNNKEKVLIFGDYDVDGVSASAILIKYFSSIQFYVDYFLPNRYIDGYGLTKESILQIKEKYNPSLIITVDCGISCYEEVEYAKTLGIDIVVTDHHDIPDTIPNTIVINPKLSGQDYPFKYLCGTGVAFKVVQALSGLENAKKYLGICAIATIADIVPLQDENRAIVKFGMKEFNSNLPLGIKMLMEDNKLDCSLSATDIAFKLSPKINAAGRMGDAGVALKLYIKDDKLVLKNTIENLNNLNLERQALCNKVYEDVIERLSKINIANYNSIVLYSKKWDSGILGIVSAKVANEFNRPTILLSEVGDELKGSARSVNDIDIFSAISSLKEVLEAFGGHKMAAGLTIKTKNFKNFIQSINKYLSEHYSPKDFMPYSNYDLDIKCEQVTTKFIKDLELLEPCGCGNPKPIFNLVLDKSATAVPMAKHPNHLNITNKNLNIVAFNSYKYLPLLKNSNYKQVEIEFQLSEYKNRVYLKGIAKNITTGKLESLKNKDVSFGEYLKQVAYFDEGNKRCENYNANSLQKLIDTAKEELFGTLFVCSSYESYLEFLSLTENDKNYQHYLFEVISNSGINSVVYCPVNFNNFGAYKNIVFLDPILSKGYVNAIAKVTNAKIFIPANKKVDKNIFKGVVTDRNVFGEYFKLLSNFASTQASFYNEIDLFKKLSSIDKKINFKQFIFCLYTFIELNIFELEDEIDTQTLKENKKVVSQLNNANFYNQVSLILKTF